jgi:hypothetical protein
MQMASKPERRLFRELERKLRRMTLLVGMIGSDAIGLLADQRRIRLAANESEFDDPMGGRKIIHLARHKVAYAVAGDDLTDEVGYGVADALDGGAVNFGSALELERSLQGIVERRIAEIQKTAARRGEQIERTLLMVFYGEQVSERQLWRVRVEAHPSAKRIDGMTIAGAGGNTARFFEHYYTPNTPIHRLLLLASHIVLMGHQIDTKMIDGLDIATFDSEGFHWFNEDQKTPLRERSAKLDSLVRRLLLEEPNKD